MTNAADKAEEIFKDPENKSSNKQGKTQKTISKRAKIILLILAILFLLGMSWWIWKDEIGFSNIDLKSSDKSATCPLTGLSTSKEKSEQRPIGIMIENHTTARPQSGINEAEMIFEAVAEGGITRFLAVYQCGKEPKEIGPVRSARIYYVNWDKGLDALYAHVGGSPDGLEQVKNLDIADLDQSYLSNFYWRSSSRTAPHNVYTTLAKLRDAAKSKNFKTTGSIDEWKYSSSSKSAEVESAELNVNFSSYNYNVSWKFDKIKNYWLRSQGGSAHKDSAGVQVSAKNLAIMFTDISTRSDGRMDIETIGSGEAKVYINGKEIDAIWKKAAEDKMLKFYDSTNKEIDFAPGNTWISAISTKSQIKYSSTNLSKSDSESENTKESTNSESEE